MSAHLLKSKVDRLDDGTKPVMAHTTGRCDAVHTKHQTFEPATQNSLPDRGNIPGTLQASRIIQDFVKIMFRCDCWSHSHHSNSPTRTSSILLRPPVARVTRHITIENIINRTNPPMKSTPTTPQQPRPMRTPA